jgi:hypothetical protein
MRTTIAVWTFSVVLLATACTIAASVDRLTATAAPVVSSVKSHVQNVGHAFHQQFTRVAS